MKTPLSSLRFLPTAALAFGGALASGCASDPAPETGSAPECVIPDNAILSTFEDGANGIKQVEGRNGGWYVYNDKTPGATQSPAEGKVAATGGGACGTDFALKTTGSGFATWGAGIGTDLKGMGANKSPYDVSKYQGITLWLKAGRADMPVRVKLTDTETTQKANGGNCENPAAGAAVCDNAYGTGLTLTTEWKKYQLPFAEMTQEIWGKKLNAFPASSILALQIQVGAADGKDGFELWVDNVGFY